MLATLGRHDAERLAAAGGEGDPDDPAVGVVAQPLHEAALLHPVHDPGRACLAHVHGVGEAAHRERPFGVEREQDLEVDEAERPTRPLPEVAHELARLGRGELVEELGGDGGSVHDALRGG